MPDMPHTANVYAPLKKSCRAGCSALAALTSSFFGANTGVLQDLILKTHRSDPQTNVTLPDSFSRRLEMKLAKSVAAGSSAMAQLSAGSQVVQPGLGQTPPLRVRLGFDRLDPLEAPLDQ